MMPNSDPYPNAMCGDLGLPSFGCQVSDGIRLEWKVAFLCPFHSMPLCQFTPCNGKRRESTFESNVSGSEMRVL